LSENLQALLRLFGLRKYEAAVYTALLHTVNASASEVAETADVPLPRVYTVIRSLENKGYVHRFPGSPSRYRASHPGLILRAELSSLRTKMESTLLEVEQEYETLEEQSAIAQFTLSTTFGDRGFVSAAIGILMSSKKEIVGAIHDLSWCLEETVLKILKEKKRDKVKIMIIGKDSPDAVENLDIVRVSAGAAVRTTPAAELKTSFMIGDSNEMILALAPPNLNNPDKISTVSIAHKNTASIFRTVFDEQWKKASELGETRR